MRRAKFFLAVVAMLAVLQVFLLLLVVISAHAQAPGPTKIVLCKVTDVEDKQVTLACDDAKPTKLFIDESEWPSIWLGKHVKDAVFPLGQWPDGKLKTMPDKAWLEREHLNSLVPGSKEWFRAMTRETPDYERNPVNH